MQYPDNFLDMQKRIHGFAKNWALEKKKQRNFTMLSVLISLVFFSHALDWSPKTKIAFATLLV
jgi:hypothetical protein